MTAVSQSRFDKVCDDLSSVVDGLQFERMRWARDVGPRLAELVTLLLGAIEARPDLEFSEERSTTEVKRYILKVHGQRVIGIALWIKDGKAKVQPVEIERSKFVLTSDTTFVVALDEVSAAWVSDALVKAFGLIEQRDEPAIEPMVGAHEGHTPAAPRSEHAGLTTARG